MGKYHYQILYDSHWIGTQENDLAIQFAEYFEQEVRKWGFIGYIEDRDLIPGRSIFHELFNVADSTEKTIFLITRVDSEWAQYAREAIFKHRIDSASRHNCIAIGLNLIHDDRLPTLLQSMKINGPVYFHGDSESQWEADKRSWNRIKKAFDIFEETEDIQSHANHMTNASRPKPRQLLPQRQEQTSTGSSETNPHISLFCCFPTRKKYISTELEDTRVRTEINDQLVAQPMSTMLSDAVADATSIEEHSGVRRERPSTSDHSQQTMEGDVRTQGTSASPVSACVMQDHDVEISPVSKETPPGSELSCESMLDSRPLLFPPEDNNNHVKRDPLEATTFLHSHDTPNAKPCPQKKLID